MALSIKQGLYISVATLSLSTRLFAATSIPLMEEKAIQQGFSEMSQAPGAVMFTPPEGWLLADPKALPSNIKVMVVGKGAREYPPSLNLAVDSYKGTLKQYLKMVKAINDKMGAEWKDLGTIRTQAGDASLSQVDSKTKWGFERQMQVILLKDGTAYILTAAALKDEFSTYYKDFFNSMRSLRINKDIYEMVSDTTKRTNLKKAESDLTQNWKTYFQKYKLGVQSSSDNEIALRAFESEDFQKSYWIPFKDKLSKEFADQGDSWQKFTLNQLENNLLDAI